MARHAAIGTLAAVARWLVERPSYMLMTAGDEQLSRRPARRFAAAWPGVMALSLGWGVLLAGLWGLSWRLFKEPGGILFTPAAVTVAVFLLWPFRRAASALSEVIAGAGNTQRAILAALLVAVLALCMLGLGSSRYHNESVLPAALAWIRPSAELYRVLIVMPLWGGWAMLITGQFCRPREDTAPAVAAFVLGCGPVAATASMLAPALLTWAYFHFLNGWEMSMSAAAVITAVVGGMALSRRTGGLKRATLLAANVLTQLAFVLSYLANR